MSYNPAAVAASTSPAGISIHDRLRNTHLDDIRRPRVLHPLENEGLRLLILENISQDAVAQFRSQGWYVDHLTKALNEDELVARIGGYHAIGIRSKTKITKRVLQAATKVRSLAISLMTHTNLIASIVACHRLLLHWHQPSRSQGRGSRWYSRLQLTVLQLSLCC